jgi:hypothetical protein
MAERCSAMDENTMDDFAPLARQPRTLWGRLHANIVRLVSNSLDGLAGGQWLTSDQWYTVVTLARQPDRAKLAYTLLAAGIVDAQSDDMLERLHVEIGRRIPTTPGANEMALVDLRQSGLLSARNRPRLSLEVRPDARGLLRQVIWGTEPPRGEL